MKHAETIFRAVVRASLALALISTTNLGATAAGEAGTVRAVPMSSVTRADAERGDTLDVTRSDDSVRDQRRSLRLRLVAGLNRRITPGFEPAEEIEFSTGGLTGIIRLDLVPEHRLRLGFESGYVKLSAANQAPTGNDAPNRLVLTSVPLLLSASMGGTELEAGFGVGYYILVVSAGTVNGTDFASTSSELGYMGHFSWHPHLFGGNNLGADFHIFSLADQAITTIALGISFRFSILEL